MGIFIVGFIVFVAIALFAIWKLELQDQERIKYLESVRDKKIILFSKSHDLKFKIDNPREKKSKEFYVYGFNISIETDYAMMGRIRIDSQEDLEDFKKDLETVGDVLKYEAEQRRMVEINNDEKRGDFK